MEHKKGGKFKPGHLIAAAGVEGQQPDAGRQLWLENHWQRVVLQGRGGQLGVGQTSLGNTVSGAFDQQ